MDWALVISAFSAAGVGSVVGSAYSQAKDRRVARGNFLDALGEVETERWFELSEGSLDITVRQARLCALLAAIPPDVTSMYLALARTAYDNSRKSWVESGETSDAINATLGRAVLEAARLLVDTAWHPVLIRLALVGRRRRLRAMIAALEPQHVEEFKRHSNRI